MSELVIDKNKKLIDSAHIGYGLQALGVFFFVPTLIASAILSHIKREQARNTWIASHFIWQTRTFWIYSIIEIIGILLLSNIFGFIILFFNHTWLMYRIIKGWLALNMNIAINI